MGTITSAGSPTGGGKVAICARRTMQSTTAAPSPETWSATTERTLPLCITKTWSNKVDVGGGSSCSSTERA